MSKESGSDVYNAMIGAVQSADKKFNISEQLPGDLTFEEFTVYNVIQFLLYLARLDGILTSREMLYIGDLTDRYLSTDSAKKVILDNDICSEEFENKVPDCINIAVQIDNGLIQQEIHVPGMLSQAMAQCLASIGKSFLEDTNAGENEEIDPLILEGLNAYVKMMEKYINEHLIDPDRPPKFDFDPDDEDDEEDDDEETATAPGKDVNVAAAPKKESVATAPKKSMAAKAPGKTGRKEINVGDSNTALEQE